MSSSAFRKALTITGYLQSDGSAVPGLTSADDRTSSRLRPIFSDTRVGLHADAVFFAQNTPTAIFKDSGGAQPTEQEIRGWHEAAWNVGLAPLLWIVTPIDIRLYDCYDSPLRQTGQISAPPLDSFPLEIDERLRALDAMCGRFATETGAFWSSPIGQRIDRRHRVDRELLGEINALEERLTLLPPAHMQALQNPKEEIRASRDFAQRLIGRCIFTSYLIDRGIAQPFLPNDFPTNVVQMFGTVNDAFSLFEWLRDKFNGDLFPMDDPGAEHQRLGEAHLALIRDFVEGWSLVPGNRGQGRLFRFRFDAIPIDLISSIYQQFARSSAAEEAHVQGLHYTPVELVHLTLDPVFDGLSANARILDPTCGSGAFLVEAFRRLVWKKSRGHTVSRRVVRQILYSQLFGIDINRSALGMAAFSLYLAALELDEEPINDVLDLKFDRLIGKTLFEADSVSDELPPEVTERSFDAVVGNPPWTFVRRAKSRSRTQRQTTIRPRRSPDQKFLAAAGDLAGDTGRIGMIMKASPFFSKDQYAIEARTAALKRLSPAALVNLSALRKEHLFPDATGPALLFFARCALIGKKNRLLVGSIPRTPDFARTGVFHVGPGELRTVSLDRVLQTPAMLKAFTFGTARDGWLIEKLERSFPTLDDVLGSAGFRPLETRGQGFQVEGDENPPPENYYVLSVLTPDQYTPFRIDHSRLERFQHLTLHRPREASIFRGPLLICPKASFRSAAEPGRYSAAVSEQDVLYTESFYGISFSGRDGRWANVLAAILNSSLASFQFSFGGGAWGLERPTVEPKDLLSLRLPDLQSVDPNLLEAVLDAERRAAEAPSRDHLQNLDRAVFELYGLERDEVVIAEESVTRARMFLFDSRAEQQIFLRPPGAETLNAYADEVLQVVNAYLHARGERHLEAIVYADSIPHAKQALAVPGIAVVRFVVSPGLPAKQPVRQGNDSDIDRLAALFQGQAVPNAPPYLNERRLLRIYGDHDLFILKPAESRYWTRTSGLNDADSILADHWIKGRHVSVN
ncbi:MAG TPA: N-6 DNA methylase [Bryobacteraceae bacterium]|nr:N-6 DNA methylase [Bryobacteraceae bacterium]